MLKHGVYMQKHFSLFQAIFLFYKEKSYFRELVENTRMPVCLYIVLLSSHEKEERKSPYCARMYYFLFLSFTQLHSIYALIFLSSSYGLQVLLLLKGWNGTVQMLILPQCLADKNRGGGMAQWWRHDHSLCYFEPAVVAVADMPPSMTCLSVDWDKK